MTTDLIDNSKFSEWKHTHQWNSCLLNREKYGKFLLNYLIEEKSGYVINIDSRWGSGKTEMLKRLYVEAMARRHPCVFIDAWVSDFSSAPLQVVASELITQLSDINEGVGDTFDKVTAVLGKFLRGTAIATAGYLSKKLLDDASMGTVIATELLAKDPKDYLNSITSDFNEQIEAINSIKLELEAVAEVLKRNLGCELPIFVFIDELDRCRPNYAVELLEAIKHFFNVPGFVFVIATDTSQITHAIKVIYGAGFDSETYLRRFFDRISSIPEPKTIDYIKALKIEHSTAFRYFDIYPKDVNYWIAEICAVYELTLRDIDQLIARLNSCLRTRQQDACKDSPVNILTLAILLIEFANHKDIYENRRGKKTIPNTSILDKKKINNDSALEVISAILSCEEKVNTDDGYSSPSKKYPDHDHFYSKTQKGNNTALYRYLSSYSSTKNNFPIDFDTQDYREMVELSASLK